MHRLFALTALRRHRWVGLGLTLCLVLALGGSLAALLPGRAHAATIPVSTCTEAALDAAVAAASPGDTITFGCSGTITLTNTLSITKNLTLDGTGHTVTLDGNRPNFGSVRVLLVASGVTFTLNHLTVANGLAPNNGGGGIFNNAGGTVTITNSTISGNGATLGGGLYNAGTMSLTNSTVSGNNASNGGGIFNNAGGTVTITNSTISGNSAGVAGGGISNFGGTVTITNSTVSGNSATCPACIEVNPNGGGIFNNTGGTVTLSNSTVSGNSAVEGGGGGAIYNAGTVTLSNSTVSGNSAGFGGGILNNYGTATITNSTVSGNSAVAEGGGIFSFSSTTTISNTIVANSPSGADCFDSGGGPITDGGYNLDDDTSCGLSAVHHSLPGTNPHLAASLAHNGGPTQTLALLSGSPAIDAGGTSANGCLATDQRGVSRPQGAACDIGAYEFVPTTTTTLTANPNPGLLDQPVQLCATVKPTVGAPGPSSGSVSFQEGTTTLGTGSLSSSGKGCFTTSTLSLGDHHITASYGGSGAKGFSGSTSAPLVVSIQVQGQDVAGGGAGGGNPPYQPPSQATGGQNASGNGTGQTQQPQQRPTVRQPGAGGIVPWLGTGLGLLLLLLGLAGLGAVFYRASRRRPAVGTEPSVS